MPNLVHKKRILGWDLDTQAMTLTLPAHHLTAIMEFLKQHITKKRVSCRQWQQLLGSLRSSAPALYGV